MEQQVGAGGGVRIDRVLWAVTVSLFFILVRLFLVCCSRRADRRWPLAIALQSTTPGSYRIRATLPTPVALNVCSGEGSLRLGKLCAAESAGPAVVGSCEAWYLISVPLRYNYIVRIMFQARQQTAQQ